MINNSPEIKKLMSPSKNDNNILAKFFRNGMALMIGHPSPTQLSAADYKYVFLSDFDRMPDDNGEGSVFIQASKRTQTFMSAGCTVVETSPGRDFLDTEWKATGEHEAPPVGGGLGLYNSGDRNMQYWTCPHCSYDIKMYPGLELFNLPDYDELLPEIKEKGSKATSEKYASLWCPDCGGEITQDNKAMLNETATWRPETDKPNSIASYWLSGYAAAFQTWESLLQKEFDGRLHLDSTGDDSKLKATRNVDQGIPHIPSGLESKLTSSALESRAEDLRQKFVPKGARFLICSIDVQKYMFVVQVEAYGVNLESWVIDRFNIDISNRPQAKGSDTMALLEPASYIEDWDVLLDACIKARYPLDDDSGRDMGIIMTVCDSHGTAGTTENAYSFWKKVKGEGLSSKFNLIRGLRPKPNATTPYVAKVVLDKSSRSAVSAKIVGEQALWNVNTTLYKDMVMGHLKRDTEGSNYIHFGNWMDSSVYAEFLAETRTEKGWENLLARRNEGFDLLAYSRAAVKIKMLTYWSDRIDWDSPPHWAQDWDTNVEVSHPDNIDKLDSSVSKPKASRGVRMRAR